MEEKFVWNGFSVDRRHQNGEPKTVMELRDEVFALRDAARDARAAAAAAKFTYSPTAPIAAPEVKQAKVDPADVKREAAYWRGVAEGEAFRAHARKVATKQAAAEFSESELRGFEELEAAGYKVNREEYKRRRAALGGAS